MVRVLLNGLVEGFDQSLYVLGVVVIDPDLDLWPTAIGSRRACVGSLVGTRHMLRVERRYALPNVQTRTRVERQAGRGKRHKHQLCNHGLSLAPMRRLYFNLNFQALGNLQRKRYQRN